MSSLTISYLTKTYTESNKNRHIVFDDFCLDINQNSIVAIVGANGCGKTTLLNCIAGLARYEKGQVKIGDEKKSNTSVGFVFQNYRESLLPWLKNIDNIACILKQTNYSLKQKRDYIKCWANDRKIVLPWDAYPYQCSGGQQQLLALIREFINNPKLLLMDEPFAALDYEKRLAWRQQLEILWDKSSTTIVIVSHDIEEAVYLADEVVVLGGQPTRVVGHHNIDMPRPRMPTLLQDEKFSGLYRVVLQSFLQTIAIV
jgi:NitT/TauT family transport system ATP-binding protein